MSDFKTITIIYDFEKDVVFIEQSKDFCDLPKIHQLDALQDAIEEVTNLYNQKLKEFDAGKIEGDCFYLKNNK